MPTATTRYIQEFILRKNAAPRGKNKCISREFIIWYAFIYIDLYGVLCSKSLYAHFVMHWINHPLGL